MTLQHLLPFLAAIDISKERHEVLIEAPDKKRRRRVSVLNNLDEFDRLISLLRSYQRPVRVAFEATETIIAHWHISSAQPASRSN